MGTTTTTNPVTTMKKTVADVAATTKLTEPKREKELIPWWKRCFWKQIEEGPIVRSTNNWPTITTTTMETNKSHKDDAYWGDYVDNNNKTRQQQQNENKIKTRQLQQTYWMVSPCPSVSFEIEIMRRTIVRSKNNWPSTTTATATTTTTRYCEQTNQTTMPTQQQQQQRWLLTILQ